MTSAPYSGESGGRPTVLVVEDEPFIAMDLAEMLQRRGWRVLGPAPTVVEGLRLLEIESPDVALLDVNLRGELITPVAVTLWRLNIPFVVSSSFSDGELEEIDVLAEAVNVRKPASEERLMKALAHTLGLHATTGQASPPEAADTWLR